MKSNVTVTQIGQHIRNKRKSICIPQKQLAKMAGISNSYLCDIESGRSHCSLQTLLKIANSLDIDCAELLRPETD